VPIWQPVTHLIYNEEQLTISQSHPLSTVVLQQHYTHIAPTHPMTCPYITTHKVY